MRSRLQAVEAIPMSEKAQHNYEFIVPQELLSNRNEFIYIQSVDSRENMLRPPACSCISHVLLSQDLLFFL